MTEPRARRLGRSFFSRPAEVVARELVGARLVHVLDGERREGIVAETEAYLGAADRACHARFGKTEARVHLFGRPGTAYVFLVYGMHSCFNVTCVAEGAGHAVLVRGVAVGEGRGRGPGKAALALGIDRRHGGIDLVRSRELYFEQLASVPPQVEVSARVGVGYAGADAMLPLRFFDPASEGTSRPSPRLVGDGSGARPPRRA